MRVTFVKVGSACSPRLLTAFKFNQSMGVLTVRTQCRRLNSCHSQGINILNSQLQMDTIYIDDNFVAVNKPVGKSVFGKHDHQGGEYISVSLFQQMSNTLKATDSNISVGLSLKSFYSGVVVFCKNEQAETRLKKSVAKAVTQKSPFLSYLAITLGKPRCPENVPLSACISRLFLHENEMSAVSNKSSISARKQGKTMQASYTVRTLTENDETGSSLVHICVDKDKWDAIPALLCNHLSPVLGDHIYSSRFHTVMGVPFLMQPHAARPQIQRLPESVSQAISSIYPNPADIPLLLHRHQVTLSSLATSGSHPIVFTAPLPDEFITVLKCLGLYKDDLFQSSDVKRIKAS